MRCLSALSALFVIACAQHGIKPANKEGAWNMVRYIHKLSTYKYELLNP